MGRRTWGGVIVAMLVAGACGDDKTGISGDVAPTIEASEGGQPVARSSTIVLGADGVKVVRITNTGSGPLLIKDVALTSEPAGAFTVAADAMPTAAAPVSIAPDASWELTVTLDGSKVPEGARPRGSVTLSTNTTIPDGLTSFVFFLQRETTIAKLVLQPPLVDFGDVASGTTSTKTLNVLNTGAAPLTISRVTLSGDPGYTALFEGTTLTSGGAAVTLPTPVTLEPSSARHVEITFDGRGGTAAAQAELTFGSNDAAAPEGTSAKLYANLAGPCLRAIPPRVDFGAKNVGATSAQSFQLESCGARAVRIAAMTLVDDGDGVFEVDPMSLPLTLEAGQRTSVGVRYTPAAFAGIGADGQPIRDAGKIRVDSDAYIQGLDVELSGFGAGCCCPVAAIDLPEGDEVTPQTELHLSALSSSSSSSSIARYKWSVIQPQGSVSGFMPSDEASTPIFVPNVVGTYIFRLEVWDAQGQQSCAAAERTVEVLPSDAIHVELLWRTPGDINESDEGSSPTFSAGSDVDLHFLYPFAVLFFDDSYDCYWLNPQLEWSPAGEEGNPRLDRDDRDGGGPENLNMRVPEAGSSYRVGVHYYNDWGYGNAFATIRVYIYGVLREQWKDVEIRNADLWESHTIKWPSGVVTRVLDGGQPKITRGYPMP